MKRALSLLIALAAISALALFCYIDKSQDIERDLVAKALKRYDEKGIDWVTPKLKGGEFTKSRYLVLNGTAPSLEAKNEAVQLVSNIDGILGVEDRIEVDQHAIQEVKEEIVSTADEAEENHSSTVAAVSAVTTTAATTVAVNSALKGEEEQLERAKALALEEAKRAKEEALKQTEEETRKRAQEEARLEEERRAKEEVEREAKRKAQEERLAKLQEEKRAKEEEARREAQRQEALKKAEEEQKAKELAELEAKMKAEAERRAKEAELEAKKRAEEKARRKVQEEKQAKEATKKLEKLPDLKREKKEKSVQIEVVKNVGKNSERVKCQKRINRLLREKKIHFNYNKAGIKSGFAILDRVAKLLKECKGTKVLIAGHTDSIGSDKYNKELSLKRANSVKKYLVVQGIKADRIITKGYGERRPIATNATEEGRAKNRRIEIKLLGE